MSTTVDSLAHKIIEVETKDPIRIGEKKLKNTNGGICDQLPADKDSLRVISASSDGCSWH